jgi:hypothetical protein
MGVVIVTTVGIVAGGALVLLGKLLALSIALKGSKPSERASIIRALAEIEAANNVASRRTPSCSHDQSPPGIGQ